MSWLRRALCALLCVAITLSLAAFIVGGPDSDRRLGPEIGQHDSLSGDDDSPPTWFRRGNPRHDNRAINLDLELSVEADFDLLDIVRELTDEPPTLESFAYISEHGQANPVRGPPRSNDHVVSGSLYCDC